MMKCNAWWMAKADVWRSQGVKSPDIHARIANRMTRVVFKMVAGRQIDRHPSRLDRGYVMDKLLTFYREHKIVPAVTVRDLKCAADHLQKNDQRTEGEKLREAALKAQRSRRKGPQELGTLLVGVLAKLGLAADDDPKIEST